ncbi:MAG TPA: hypothetical protein VFT34_03760, partial [Verrucomicrobiae bacterium]|nr:hypothetical protein [Verrucomicrobiae bacterium]
GDAIGEPDHIRVEFLDTDVIRLANCVAYTNVAPPTNLVLGAFLDYYVFEVTTNSVETRFEVVPLTNEVNAYLRRELLLPRSDYFDYAGTNTGLNPEYFLVGSNSVPTPLSAGLWFLAVENPSVLNRTSTYFVRVVNTSTTNITRLVNEVCLDRTLPPLDPSNCQGVDYFVYRVPSNAVEVAFKLFHVDGDIDVYFTSNLPLPSSTNGFLALAFGTAGGPFQGSFAAPFATNVPPLNGPPLTPGDWYIAVVNHSNSPTATYSICVTEYVVGATNAGGIVRLSNGVAYSNTVPAVGRPALGPMPLTERQFYIYTVSSNGVQANFESFGASGNVDLFIRRTVPLATELLTENAADAASVNAGTTNELIVLATNSSPVALAPGDWYISIANREPAPVNYNVRVTEYIIDNGTGTNGLVSRLIGGDCQSRTNAGTNVLGSPAIDYYFFTVTNGAARAYFELSGLSADLTLLVRRELPLPGLTNYDAISANPGVCEEFISLSTNAANPIVLEPGNWYLAVVSTNPMPASYTICAIQSDVGDARLRISNISLVTNWLCLSWTNTLPGVFYHVQALSHLGSSNWVAFSPTLPGPSAGLESMWCTNRPDAFHFFRIKEGPGPKLLNTSVALSCLECRPTGFRACWTGPANQQYAVEWTPVLVPATWQSLTNVTSATTDFEFTDPDAQCGVPGQVRFYRVLPLDR